MALETVSVEFAFFFFFQAAISAEELFLIGITAYFAFSPLGGYAEGLVAACTLFGFEYTEESFH